MSLNLIAGFALALSLKIALPPGAPLRSTHADQHPFRRLHDFGHSFPFPSVPPTAALLSYFHTVQEDWVEADRIQVGGQGCPTVLGVVFGKFVHGGGRQ